MARVAFRADLAQPELSQCLVDLRGELVGQVGTGVPVRHGGHVDQQPGITPPQLDLRGMEQAEHGIGDHLVNGKRAQPPRMLADVIGRPRWLVPGTRQSPPRPPQ
jgi:hypothetical protein